MSNEIIPSEKRSEPTEAPKPSENVLDKASALADRLEAANKRTEELVKRQEDVAARLMLSGRAEAGKPQPTPDQEIESEVKKRVEANLKQFGYKR